MSTAKILIVEDEDIIRNALKKLLQRNDYEISEAASVDEAKQQNFDDFNMVISDLRLPGGQGTDLIPLSGETPVLIMTSYGSMRSAVDAMKQGAVDYIAKPFDHAEMLETVARIIADHPKQAKADSAPSTTETSSTPRNDLSGNSAAMQSVQENISKVAPTPATVLIVGETGTGKELAANAIHQQSQRASKPLISVNCAAIPENLIEAELFGHEKGAFSGADSARSGLITASDGGTLFLDEIGELPLEAQARLLRVLQENEVRPIGAVEAKRVDLRLIAATHRDLKQLCSEGKFREDLYFRINVFQVPLPPLRDRQEDILPLAKQFLQESCSEMNKALPEISEETAQSMIQHSWPGNVRELKNAIQRAAILNDGSQAISVEQLELQGPSDSDNTAPQRSPKRPPSKDKKAEPSAVEVDKSRVSLDDYFVNFVLENQASMSETQLAKQLGISRKNLWERRQKLGIPRKKS